MAEHGQVIAAAANRRERGSVKGDGEANRAHKHTLALSQLCRERGDPEHPVEDGRVLLRVLGAVSVLGRQCLLLVRAQGRAGHSGTPKAFSA